MISVQNTLQTISKKHAHNNIKAIYLDNTSLVQSIRTQKRAFYDL